MRGEKRRFSAAAAPTWNGLSAVCQMYETFKQQTILALIDYSDMQCRLQAEGDSRRTVGHPNYRYREATIKADLSSLNVLCREKAAQLCLTATACSSVHVE